ncbi:MAG: DUF1254 domain-containing protein [Eubacterium sp.]|nr:DUF1254 domain-containing protein [Eubacterium sp.]
MNVVDVIENAFYSVMPLVSRVAYCQIAMCNNNDVVTNKVFHRRTLAPPKDAIHAPNIDTVYSNCYIDLSAGDVIIHKPAAESFFNIQLLDAYAVMINFLGTGGLGGADECNYLLTTNKNADYGEKYIKIVSPTAMVTMIARIIVNGESAAEYKRVHDIQDNLTVKPSGEVDPAFFPRTGGIGAQISERLYANIVD